MTVVYNATLKTKRMNLVGDSIDGKTINASSGAGAAGQLVIGTSALSGATGVLAIIPLPLPSMSVSGPVSTLLGVPLSVVASATGTAAKADLRTAGSPGTDVVQGLSVGTSAADVIVSSTSIISGQTVTVTAGTLTHG